jgi:hypothetical protein
VRGVREKSETKIIVITPLLSRYFSVVSSRFRVNIWVKTENSAAFLNQFSLFFSVKIAQLGYTSYCGLKKTSNEFNSHNSQPTSEKR